MHRDQDAKAVLHITISDPACVTQAVGLVPDVAWAAGEIQLPRRAPAKFGAWRLEESEGGLCESDFYAAAIERCLRRLLARIVPRQVRERLAIIGAKPVIVLTGFAYEFPNVFVPADLIAKIAELGAELEEDFYLLPGEEGEEM